jgi:hypothetical protein
VFTARYELSPYVKQITFRLYKVQFVMSFWTELKEYIGVKVPVRPDRLQCQRITG